MADNVTIPATGTGTATPVIAADDVSSVFYQRVKLDGGGDGLSVPIVAGQQLAAGSVPVVLTAAQVTTLTPPAALTGFATSAKQDTGNTSLSSIDGKITAVNTGAVVISSGSVTSNAGTNLNTSALALEAGGNLAAAAASLSVLDDWDESDRAKVNLIVGQAGIAAGAGAVGVTVPRVTHASDDPAVTSLATLVTQTAGMTVPTTIYNGKKTVTTAGTRVTLASSQAVKTVTIKALVANTGVIYVGDGSVASTTGFALNAGDTISFDIANLATVNIDSSVNGEGVTYLGVN